MKVNVFKKDDGYYNISRKEKEDMFKKSLSIFKKRVADSGVLQECKKREFYESPGQKRRRKKKESVLLRKKELKNKHIL
jgi:ribosomal protein S21